MESMSKRKHGAFIVIFLFPIKDSENISRNLGCTKLKMRLLLKGFGGSFVWNGLFIPLLCKPLLIYLDKKTQ